MSERHNLAEHGTAFCIAALGLAAGGWGIAVPAAVIAAIGYERWKSCDAEVLRKAQQRALKDLQQAKDISNADVGAAARYLASAKTRLRFEPAQMVEVAASGDVPKALMEQLFGSEIEREDPGVKRAISVTLQAAFDVCRTSDKYKEVFNQEAVLAILKSKQLEYERLDRIEAEVTEISKHLASVREARRDLLLGLATHFVVPNPFQLSDSELRNELEKVAEEYRALRQLVRSANIDHDLRIEAEEALEAGNFGKAVELLRSARTKGLEEDAKLAELQADVELLRRRVEQAYFVLSSVADSFFNLDPLASAIRRDKYAKVLRKHGLQFGSSGLHFAIQIREPALKIFEEEKCFFKFVICLSNHANVQQELGSQIGGSKGKELLKASIANYRRVLSDPKIQDNKKECVRIRINFGNALLEYGRLFELASGESVWAAIDAFETALGEDLADLPNDEWARCNNSLGSAYHFTGLICDGLEAIEAFEKSGTAFCRSLKYRTRSKQPSLWATTVSSLGVSLMEQGKRLEGDQAINLLDKSARLQRVSLKLLSPEINPMSWSNAQSNLGNALLFRASAADNTRRKKLLEEAIKSYENASKLRTRGRHPVLWAETQENLAIAKGEQASLTRGMERQSGFKAALLHVDAALEEFDAKSMNRNHEKASRMREAILFELAQFN